MWISAPDSTPSDGERVATTSIGNPPTSEVRSTTAVGRDTPRLAPQLRDAVARRLRDDGDLLAGGADRGALRRAVARALAAEGVVAAPDVWARLVRDLVDELGGLGPLEALLRDPAVTDVMVNGGDEVHVERDGRLERTDVRFDDDAHLTGVVRRVLGPLGVRLDRAHPYADAVLAGGVRLHAILPPLSSRPTLTLRRVPAVVPTWEQLEAVGSVPADLRALLREATADRRNVVVAGRAGVGKTTLLGRLLAEVGDDRVVVIEDAPELRHPAPHTVHLQVRAATPDGIGAVDVATLLRNALRMRPDRLVVGEVRGAEVADLLQAMNTGHDGSMTTVHANGADEAIVRLEGMALLAGIPLSAARSQTAAALDLIVALDRDRDGRRRVGHVVEVDADRDGARTSVRWSR
ncbi:MAG: ATPase, T2SS/T4P/T4SS family [Nitriliruptor sp.]